MVGAALKFVGDASVPWQRVVSSSGAISERGDGGAGARRQAERLRAEGVAVSEARGAGVGTGGRWRVSLNGPNGYGWCEYGLGGDSRLRSWAVDVLDSHSHTRTQSRRRWTSSTTSMRRTRNAALWKERMTRARIQRLMIHDAMTLRQGAPKR